jgi:3-carboxy-cis,cis-muconate cycloisomerase
MTDLPSSMLLTPLISSAAMRTVLDDRARLQRMLDFIVALARAEAAVGIVPALASDQIANAAKAERYDVKALGEEAVAAGNIAIPLINGSPPRWPRPTPLPPAGSTGARPARTSSTPDSCSICGPPLTR